MLLALVLPAVSLFAMLEGIYEVASFDDKMGRPGMMAMGGFLFMGLLALGGSMHAR